MAEPFSFSATLAAIKNAGPAVYAAAFIGSGLILFLPDNLLGALGLTEFKLDYRTYLGAAFLGSACLLAAHIIFATGPFLKDSIKRWRFNHGTRDFLKNLTADEKAFLRPYIIDGENTLYKSAYDGVANGLMNKAIVYRASQISVPGAPGLQMPFNLSPIVRKILMRNPHYLE